MPQLDPKLYPRPRRLYNLRQQLRSLRQLPPLDNYNNESGPGEIFQCQECGYLRPWSRGCGDDMEEVCDHCWSRHQQQGEIIEDR